MDRETTTRQLYQLVIDGASEALARFARAVANRREGLGVFELIEVTVALSESGLRSRALDAVVEQVLSENLRASEAALRVRDRARSLWAFEGRSTLWPRSETPPADTLTTAELLHSVPHERMRYRR